MTINQTGLPERPKQYTYEETIQNHPHLKTKDESGWFGRAIIVCFVLMVLAWSLGTLVEGL